MSTSVRIIRAAMVACSLAAFVSIVHSAPLATVAVLPDDLSQAHSIWIPKDEGGSITHAWIVNGARVRTPAGSDAAGALQNHTGFVSAIQADLDSAVIADLLGSRYTGTHISPQASPSMTAEGSLVSDIYAFYRLDSDGTRPDLIGVARCDLSIGIQVGHDLILCQAGVPGHLEDGMTVGITREGLPVSIENSGFRIIGPAREGWLAISSEIGAGPTQTHLVRIVPKGHKWEVQGDLGELPPQGYRVLEPRSTVLVDVDIESPSASTDVFEVISDGIKDHFFVSPSSLVSASRAPRCTEPKQLWFFTSKPRCSFPPFANDAIRGSRATVTASTGGPWLLTDRSPPDFFSFHWGIYDLTTNRAIATLGVSEAKNPITVIRSSRGAYVFDRRGPAYDFTLQQWNAAVPTWWASVESGSSGLDRQ